MGDTGGDLHENPLQNLQQNRKARYLTALDALAATVRAVRERREQLALLGNVFDLVDRGHVLEAKVWSHGLLTTATDVGSETVGFVYHDGHALGFEGKAGEMVIMVDFIQLIKPDGQGGVYIELDSGERIWLGFHS